VVIITDGYYSIGNSVGIYWRTNAVGIYWLNYREIYRFIFKKSSSMTWQFLRAILPTNSNWNLCTVTWQIHHQNYRGNHRQKYSSVIPLVRVNISSLYLPSPPLFLRLLPHLNSPLSNCKQPPPLKISTSSQHKSSFYNFCGHNIRVLIYCGFYHFL